MKRMISIDKWELSFDFNDLTKLKLENENNLIFENFNLQYIKLDNAGQKKVDDYIQDLINTNKYNKKK